VREVIVNGRWPLTVPDESASTPGWGWWEVERLAAMYACIRPGDVVWEVGAERGYQAALYATWGARLVLVEAQPDWNGIADVFEANGVTFEALIGERVGSGGLRDQWKPLDILDETRSLRPQVISIDVEGAEYRVLLGATKLLTETRPVVFVAVHPEVIRSDYGDTPDDVLCHLEKLGYQIAFLGYDHERHYMAKPRP
jgi:hypothetical protein